MSNITNLNRDYLIKINVKEATIDVPKMTFWNTDKKTSNMFVQLVINMSTNELISQYVTVQNATDYKITLNVIKPKTKQYKTIEATLLNEEKALFEIDLPDEYKDQVGNYNFEFEVSSKVDGNDESITTSNGTYKVNGSILTNLNEETSSSPDLPILKQLIEQVKSLQGGDLTGYQKKSDNSLETTSKEVVGAINEVNSQFKDIAKQTITTEERTKLTNLENYDDASIKNDIQTQKARIDSFTSLKEGSTTGDAELIDGRIGADGVTYNCLGDAVRGQIGDINNVIGLNNMDALYDFNGTLTSSAGNSGTIYIVGDTYDVTGKFLTYLKIKVASDCEYKIYIFNVINEGETADEVSLYKIISVNLTSGINNIALTEILPNKIRIGISGENNTIYYGNNGTGSTFFIGSNTSNWPNEGAKGSIMKKGGKIDFSIGIYVRANSLNKIEKLENKIKELESKPKLNGKKILLFGDSRSSSDYTWYKDKLEEKTGAIVLNKGKSGATPKSMIDEGYLDEMLNVEHDICIMFLCGNISGYSKSLGTFSWGSALQTRGEDVVTRCEDLDTFDTTTYSKPIQQIDYMIQKYNNKYYNDRQHKLYVLTDVPSKRKGESHGYRIVCNLGKSEMIKEVCTQNEVTYIDTMRECGFNEDFEPAYTPPTDTTTNNGVYYMDGLHLNEFGCDVLTNIICKNIL